MVFTTKLHLIVKLMTNVFSYSISSETSTVFPELDAEAIPQLTRNNIHHHCGRMALRRLL